MYELTDVNLAWNYMETSLTEILSLEAPVVKVQPTKHYKSWVTKETKTMMVERDNAKTASRLTGTPEDRDNFKKLRNKVSKAVKNNRKDYYKEKYEKCEQTKEISMLYKIAREQMGGNKGGPPVQLVIEGRNITSPKDMAQEQMNFFVKKNKKLMNEVQGDSEIDPLETLNRAVNDWTAKGNVILEINLREVDTGTIARLIGKLNDSNAMGFDNLEATVIKMAAWELLHPITFLTNLSIKNSEFPTKWKIGCVLPLHKGKGLARHLPSSYHPITLLPATSKLIERAVQEQLVAHLKSNKLIHPNQHAYRKGRSTTTAFLELSDKLFEAAEEKQIAAALSIDQSAAFDSLCHETLQRKIKVYGLSEKTCQWIGSYLSYRSQFVEIGTQRSTIKPVIHGVPEGSVWDPHYFCYT